MRARGVLVAAAGATPAEAGKAAARRGKATAAGQQRGSVLSKTHLKAAARRGKADAQGDAGAKRRGSVRRRAF